MNVKINQKEIITIVIKKKKIKIKKIKRSVFCAYSEKSHAV